MLDVAAVRSQFPALATGAAYFDGPGGSQVPQRVIDAMAGYLRDSNSNLGGAFRTSRESDEVMERGRAAAADFTGGEPEGIAFGANMTTLNFQLAHAVARTMKPGDEIVVTALDHDANVSPWLVVAEDHGLVVRTAPLRVEDMTLDVNGLEELLTDRTRVVAFTLASNAVGSIPDAERIAAAAHSVGALAWADAVHMAPHRRLRAREIGLDVQICSPYKFFGPHLGIAAIRPDLAESLPADRVRPADETPPGHRFEAGTQSHEAVAGATAAIHYLRDLGGGSLDTAFDAIEEHETKLSARFLAACRMAWSSTESAHPRAGRRPSASTWPAAVPARWPSCSASRTSTSGTATTTPSSQCAPWASTTPAAQSEPASSTTQPRKRSTACSKH